VTPDFENFGISGHSKGGNAINKILNTYPTYVKSFFGVSVDSAPPMSGSSEPRSLDDKVMFKHSFLSYSSLKKIFHCLALLVHLWESNILFFGIYEFLLNRKPILIHD
jgi:hypothetical protein